MPGMRTNGRYAGVACGAALLFLLVGCQPSAEAPSAAPAVAAPQALAISVDASERARQGATLYAANCAVCHGARAEGASNWQKPGADGKYPAPPLNGTGHAWHHPLAVLKTTIKGGTLRLGGSMPAWGDKLSDEDIEAIIAWFQSHWPAEIHQSWLAMDEKAKKGKAAH